MQQQKTRNLNKFVVVRQLASSFGVITGIVMNIEVFRGFHSVSTENTEVWESTASTLRAKGSKPLTTHQPTRRNALEYLNV